MKIFLPLLVFLFSSCSHKKPTVDPELYLKLHRTHEARHKACEAQNKEVFSKAITENIDAELDDENFFFVRSQEKALAFMKKVDLRKLTLRENQQEYEALIRGCQLKKDPAHKVCDTLEPPMKYYRGLIYALRQYEWPSATEDLAVRHILQYVRYVAESRSTLINIAIANDLLARLGSLGYVPERIRVQAIDFRDHIDRTYEALNQKITKFSKKKFECEDAVKILEEEKVTISTLSEQFLMLLRQTN